MQTKHLCVLVHIRICESLLLFVFVFAILRCLFLASLWSSVGERADLLAFLYVMFSCGFVTFPFGVLGQV